MYCTKRYGFKTEPSSDGDNSSREVYSGLGTNWLKLFFKNRFLFTFYFLVCVSLVETVMSPGILTGGKRYPGRAAATV